MATEKYWWEDKTVQIPKGLLLADVTGEELAVYAKMKGFGPEARASLKALAFRLGWSEAKTRKHQGDLWRKGWITLLKEGVNQEPRQWYMATAPKEQPPQELVARVTKNVTLPPQGYENDQGVENPPPGKTAPKANNDIQTNKDLNKQATKARQDEFWQKAKAIWKAKPEHAGQELAWPTQAAGFQNALTKALEKFGVEELARRFENCVNDPWSRPTLRGFVFDPDKWIARREKGATGGRPFQQPKAEGWTPELR